MAAISFPLTAAEGLQAVRSILNEPTAAFWLDEEINNWIITASQDVALRGLGVIKSDSITLATDTQTYTAFTSAVAVNKGLHILGITYPTTHRGLMRIKPTNMGHLAHITAGPPQYYYHYNNTIGVFPVPTVTENNAVLPVYYVATADDIGELPPYYQEMPIWYALSMAYAKAGRDSWAQLASEYYESTLAAFKNDVYDLPPDSYDMLKQPDRTVLAK
jgi:hypothetical protein